MRAFFILAAIAIAAYLAFAPPVPPPPETYGDIARRECQREWPRDLENCFQRKMIVKAAERFSARP